MLGLKHKETMPPPIELDRFRSEDGRELRVMQYKIPEPGYHSASCGSKEVHQVDLHWVSALVYQCVGTNQLQRIFDVCDGGLGSQIIEERSLGLNSQGFAGEELTYMLLADCCEGFLGFMLRVPFISSDEGADRFINQYTTASGRKRMGRFARYLDRPRLTVRGERNESEEAGLNHALLTFFGLALRPPQPPTDHFALQALHDMIMLTSGFIFPPPPRNADENKNRREALMEELADTADEFLMDTRREGGGCCGDD